MTGWIWIGIVIAYILYCGYEDNQPPPYKKLKEPKKQRKNLK